MFRVTTVFNQNTGNPLYSVMHFEGTGAVEAAAVVTATRTFWTNASSSIITGTQIQVQPEVEEVDPATGNTTAVHVVPNPVISGAGAGEFLPFATQGLIRWRTNVYVAGREIRGRTFVPFPAEGVNSGGTPHASYIDDIQGAADLLVQNSDFGIYSPTNRLFVLGATASVWNQWAVLRSRRS